ncbi:hypothetical protein DPEC_G00223330 [Dallia pectoralis]|uniref:Uncharacterized protein n=1 Tax=Dallia pectoralis TaxID=75939 RepID=A0ACC2G064_DALPE|nr:hypothetical protein DPEC_G00223330 [Dallia pectoralis]
MSLSRVNGGGASTVAFKMLLSRSSRSQCRAFPRRDVSVKTALFARAFGSSSRIQVKRPSDTANHLEITTDGSRSAAGLSSGFSVAFPFPQKGST